MRCCVCAYNLFNINTALNVIKARWLNTLLSMLHSACSRYNIYFLPLRILDHGRGSESMTDLTDHFSFPLPLHWAKRPPNWKWSIDWSAQNKVISHLHPPQMIQLEPSHWSISEMCVSLNLLLLFLRLFGGGGTSKQKPVFSVSCKCLASFCPQGKD